MEQIKLAADLSQDQALEQETTAKPASTEVRTLSDLEMVLCGGGEGMVNW